MQCEKIRSVSRGEVVTRYIVNDKTGCIEEITEIIFEKQCPFI